MTYRGHSVQSCHRHVKSLVITMNHQVMYDFMQSHVISLESMGFAHVPEKTVRNRLFCHFSPNVKKKPPGLVPEASRRRPGAVPELLRRGPGCNFSKPGENSGFHWIRTAQFQITVIWVHPAVQAHGWHLSSHLMQIWQPICCGHNHWQHESKDVCQHCFVIEPLQLAT